MHLPALQSDRHMFSILGLHRYTVLASQLGVDFNISGGLSQLQSVVQSIIHSMVSEVSAVVVEPQYSFPLLLEHTEKIEKGLLVSLTASQAQLDVTSLPQLNTQWGIEEVANNYATAYLPLSYHPAELMAGEKKKIVAEIHDSCQRAGIDLVLDLQVYLQPDQPQQAITFQETQLQAIQELRANCELLMLQYPQDALAAATITAELDTPWVVWLAGESYEQVKQGLRTSLENGAQGFVADDAIWSEIAGMRTADMAPDLDAIHHFLQTVGRDRIIELTRITNEFGKKPVRAT